MGSLDFARSTIPDGLRRLYQWGTSVQKLSVGDVAEPHWHIVQDAKEEISSHEIAGLAVGENAAVALSASGALWTWKAPGSDTSLAFARTKNPARLVSPSMQDVQVAGMGLTDDDLVLISDAGTVWQWRMMGEAPAPIRGLPEDVRIHGVSCGSEHAMVWSPQGAVFSWGANEYGQLGLGDQDDRSLPELVELSEGDSVRSVACAKNYTVLLLACGDALSCGEMEDYVLGQGRWRGRPEDGPGRKAEGEDDEDDDVPDCSPDLLPVSLPRNVRGMLVQVSCAAKHTVALTSDGRVVTWGLGEGGRLGRKKKVGVEVTAHAQPAVVRFEVPDQNMVSVSAGGAHTVGVSAGGQLWLWGQVSANTVYTIPRLVLGPKLGHAYFLSAYAGEWLTMAVAVPPPQDFDDEGEDN